MTHTKFKNESGFTQIDNEIFYIQSVVTASAFSVLIRVYRATQGYGVAVKALSGTYLQKTTNLSKNTVSKAIKELEDIGVLLVKRRARLPSYYQVSVRGVSKVYREVKETLSEEEETLSLDLEYVEVAEDSFDHASTEDSKEELVLPDSGFDIFWNIYDKKLSKHECKVVWNKLPAKDHREIMKTLEDYVSATPEKQFRKDPINYLKSRAWEYEVIVRSAPTPPVENKSQLPQNFLAPVEVKREVVKEGSEADEKINNFLRTFGKKGSTYA